MKYKKGLIVALDFDEKTKAESLIEKLDGLDVIYKIGLGSLFSYGFDLAKELGKKGYNIFIDAKVYDIPNTVFNAVSCLLEAEPKFLTVNAEPGIVEAVCKANANFNNVAKVLAVTVLTSVSSDQVGFYNDKTLENVTLRRARSAIQAGADGLIASSYELITLRKNFADTLLVTPGIRLNNALQNDDQSRTATPDEAIKKGANFIVVGRPITGAKNPRPVAESILASLE